MNLEIVALDTTTPQLLAPQTGDGYLAPRTLNITPEANTSALTASSYSVTGTGTTPMVDLSGAWSTTGTATLIKANLTADTGPSNAESLLMDLQVGGTPIISVRKDGFIFSKSVTGNQSVGLQISRTSISNQGAAYLYQYSLARLGVRIDGIAIDGAVNFGFSSGRADAGTIDTILARDAADTLAQRRTTNAQTFRIYNTYTDASNYERGKLEWASNVLRIGTEKAGTGTSRALELQTDGTTRVLIDATGTFDVLNRELLVTTSAVMVGSSNAFGFTSTDSGNVLDAVIKRAGTGILTLGNASTITDFNRLQFGGTTSSFPALKRSSATLISRLADDSANAAFEAASLKTDAPTGGTAATWKLGAVASVSPTSPNRTIEVDIGGTIYYLHAKTTND